MNVGGFALFATPIGACGIAWGPGGLIGTQLPMASDAAALTRLARRFPDCTPQIAPAEIERWTGRIAAHLGGADVDYSDTPLDFSQIGDFEARVYRAAQGIPAGETRTYGALAAEVGEPRAAQAVGQALGRNPWPIVVPCHRITAADGGTGGFSAPGGAVTKIRLLEIEGALAAERLPLFSFDQR